MEQLPEGVHLLALTHRGHGGSSRPATGCRMEDLAADALAFLDALHLRQACVVGHSMGSFVAQELALSHPERVSRFDRASQDALCSRIPGVRLKVYADTGHTPHWERPADFTRDLVAF